MVTIRIKILIKLINSLTPVAKANKKYRFLKKYLRVKSTLEVGPGSGFFSKL